MLFNLDKVKAIGIKESKPFLEWDSKQLGIFIAFYDVISLGCEIQN